MSMSLLDDARRLAEASELTSLGLSPVDSHCRCHWCGEFATTEPHAPDCPWLSMPKIVAALEAQQKLLEMLADPSNWGDCCGHDQFKPFHLESVAQMALGAPEPDWYYQYTDEERERVRALVAALKGRMRP